MKKRKGDDWFPFWIDKWLLGSTRDELTIEQCAVWIDFLALSNKDEGYIRANVGIPYPLKRLAGLLNRPEKLIQETIDRCLDPKVNKLRREPDGTLYVISHPVYELSKRQKRRLSEDGCPENGHDVQKTDTKNRIEKNRIEKIREEENKKYEKEFNEFLKIYNLNAAPKDAFKAFKALRRKGIVFKTIKEAVKGYANHLKNEPWKKQMYPATFLRSERWKDFIGVKHEEPL